MILAGAGGGRQWHTPVSASAPLQFLGDISYSLYLWHWPLILLTPFAFADTLAEGRLTLVHRLGILVAAVVLAWLSKVLVENRGMVWAPLAGSTRNTFAAMVAGMAAVSLVAGTLIWTYDRQVAQAAKEVATAQSRPTATAPPRCSRVGDARTRSGQPRSPSSDRPTRPGERGGACLLTGT